jgi:hypothetical protein
VTSAAKIAESVADNASTVADNMFIYMSAAPGSEDRAKFIAETAPQIERLNEAWFRLTLQHKLEAFDARINEIDRKENSK